MEEINAAAFETLVQWIRSKSGGHVHGSLELRRSGPTRGVFAAKAIKKGESLITLPPGLVLSGEALASTYGVNRISSPWLRAIGAIYKARNEELDFNVYLRSLPASLETLLEWSTHEIGSYLAGTTIGAMVMLDREQKALETRFKSAVKPYLASLGVIATSALSESDELDIDSFRHACMLVSTRGFHLQQDDSQHDAYHGPFLLPCIDLLNHDSANACTTLKRDPITKAFFMVSERDIDADEEILHSYGSHLTSDQVLQTFGFVPQYSIDFVSKDGGVVVEQHLSPASFSKEEIVQACKAVVQSNYVDNLRKAIDHNTMSEDDVWELDVHDQALRDFSMIPDDLVVKSSEPLSDELITLCCLFFLPADVYEEVSSGGELSVLDRSILDDYFLGKLVCHAVLQAIRSKFGRYDCLQIPGIDDGMCRDDKTLLCHILQNSVDKHRAVYGLTIRLEEKACLHALRSEILRISDMLDESTSSASTSSVSPSCMHLESEGQPTMEEPAEKKAKMILSGEQ
jgi:hypothetical protein